jgi:hypothetical protein
MNKEKLQALATLLKQQEELIKENIILVRGTRVSLHGQSDDDLFQMLLQNYPKSAARFEILYKRFSCLHKLQQKRVAKLKLAKDSTFEEEKKRIADQNRLFTRFCKKALGLIPQDIPSQTQGMCLGSTLDLTLKKIAKKPKKPVITQTARGENLQQKYIACRHSRIEKLHSLYTELASIHFEKQVTYSHLYELLCKKWTKAFKELGGKKAQNEFLRAKKIFEKKKLRGNRRNLSLYKKFFRKVNEYALLLIDAIPETMGKEL